MDKMEFKLNRETFSTVETVLEDAFEQSMEKDFVLPDYYPDIFRILKCSVQPKVVSHSISGGKLTFETAASIRVLYLSENDCRIHCIEQKLSFSKTAELNGECVNPMIKVTPKCDYINCRVVNQRRLDLRGAMTTTVKVTSEVKREIVTDAFGCSVQLKKQIFTYPSQRLNVAKRITVIEELELSSAKPSVGAVINTDCTIVPQDRKIIAGKLITKGEAAISMLYTCITPEGEDSVESMKFTVPFSQIIDVDGIDETFEAELDIEVGGCEIIPKGEDSTSLECELTLLVSCTALKYETCEIVSDAYSTACECELKSCEAKTESQPLPVSAAKSAETSLKYSDGEIGCVYDCRCECSSVSSRLDPERKCFDLSGNVKFFVLGRSADKTPFCLEADTPFECEIPVPEGCTDVLSCSYEPKVTVSGCSYYLADGNTIEAKAELKIAGFIREQLSGSLLSDIVILTDKPKVRKDNYALKLCCVTKDDDIWEIAKRYSTSVTAIMEENELSDDKAVQQGMLLIPLMN